MQHSLGRCLAAVNPTAIPRLPHNPSRVNRLVVESLREHSKANINFCRKIYYSKLQTNSSVTMKICFLKVH